VRVSPRLASALAAAPLLLLSAGALHAATPLEKHLQELLRRFHGVMGVAAINLDTGEAVAVTADKRFPTASLIKVAVMVEVYHKIAEGKLRRDNSITLAEADKAGGETVPLTSSTPERSLRSPIF